MKLLTFSTQNDPRPRLGAFDSSNIIDLTKAHREYSGKESLGSFSSVSGLLNGAENAFELAEKMIEKAKDMENGCVIDPSLLNFFPVITHCAKILCVTVNYAEHGKAYSTKPPEEPYIFIKLPSTLVGHNQNVILSKTSNKPDNEIELGVVIGKRGKYITKEQALDHVAGYTIFNDFSFRDRRVNKSDPSRINWLHLKNLDTAAPIGPWLVTKDEISDPNNLSISLQLNDSESEKEQGSTSGMVHKIPSLIEYISNGVTLEPGDVISTGTPLSIALGRERFLKDGDVVKASIEKIGTLVNYMKSET